MYGHRARIGYLSPILIAEPYVYEFYQVVPEGVALAVVTLNEDVATPEEAEECFKLGLQMAKRLAESGVDIIIQGSVGTNLIRGPEGINQFVQTVQNEYGVRATTSVTCQMEALKAVGAKRLAVLRARETHDNSNQAYWDYLTNAGYEIVGVDYFTKDPLYNWIHLGKVDPEETMQKAIDLGRKFPDADTILVTGPQIPFATKAENVEQETGQTVISSLLAQAWSTMRTCGVQDSIPGFGKLLRDH